MKAFFGIVCTLIITSISQAQTTQVIPAPLGGHIPIMSIDGEGHQHVLAPSYKLEMNPIPESATSVTIEFQEQDAPTVGIENLGALATPMHSNAGIIHSFTWRRWPFRTNWYWQDGYWGSDGLWRHGSDIPVGVFKPEINGTGTSNGYPWTLAQASAYDGILDWGGASGAYWSGQTCGLWIVMTITDPSQVNRFKHAGPNGKVVFWYSPRAMFGCWPDADNPVHWYPSTPDSQGTYAWECNYTTSIGSILVIAQ